jgi:hypothetical protein
LREDLLALAADAAVRAWELAVGLGRTAGLTLGEDEDLARRADAALGTPAFSTLAARSGIGGRELARWGLAWRYGGAAGLELLREEWDPAPGQVGAAGTAESVGPAESAFEPAESAFEPAESVELMKAARVALRDAAGVTASITRNRVTAGRLQLRLGRDFLWYPYAWSDGDWEPAGPPRPDAARAVELL